MLFRSVKYRSPLYDELRSLRKILRSSEDPEIKKVIERVDFAHLFREQRFFYPFEVQIIDLKNYEEAENGRASHSSYKAAQAQMAMKRVLGQLLGSSAAKTAEEE